MHELSNGQDKGKARARAGLRHGLVVLHAVMEICNANCACANSTFKGTT